MIGVKRKAKCILRSRKTRDKRNTNVARQKKKNNQKGETVSSEIEEVEINDDDVAYFEANKTASSFLLQLDEKSLRSERVKHSEAVFFEEIESKRRQAAWNKKPQQLEDRLTQKLPLKNWIDGSVLPNRQLIQDMKEHEQNPIHEETRPKLKVDVTDTKTNKVDQRVGESSIKVTKVPSDQINSTTADSSAQLEALRDRRIASRKVQIAELCENILENPDEALRKRKDHPERWSKLEELHHDGILQEQDLMIRKLAMLSELAIFLDILPEYRIRSPSETDTERNAGKPQLKKKVQSLLDSEISLLQSYQAFLKYCSSFVIHTVKEKNTSHVAMPSPKALTSNLLIENPLTETAVKCLTELLKAKYSFNFHVDLIRTLIPLADSSSGSIRLMACDAFKAVFCADKTFEVSLKIVQYFAAYIKRQNYRTKRNIVDSLLVLPLDVTMEAGENARKHAKSDRKKRRKLKKQGDSIKMGLKEAEAVVDSAERSKTQADILHEIVLIYFRILKQSNDSQVIPPVLEGLSKFGNLINLDILTDLLNLLKSLLQKDELSSVSAFHAILMGVKALQGPGQELMVDEKEFIDALYFQFGKLAYDVACSNEKNDSITVAMSCMNVVFLRRKELTFDRVGAFIKRMLIISLSLAPHQTLAILATIRGLFNRYSKLHQLLESEVDRVASGDYRADVDDPDFSNPFSSACWDLSLLERHYHPFVASFACETAQATPNLPSEMSLALLKRYDTTGTGVFVPSIAIPTRNPLYGKMKDQQSKKRKRSKEPGRIFIKTPVRKSPFLDFCIRMT
uniref:Nucleolar complex protein 3 putative n=1 Tax=Albugo laibachii Nc14 TaxID=890382 RepID=F0WMD0_9STRA|nr:nucleolar complex protein 3 putative [Albugo laibachii Nc14]|eukprot:CCA22461.1 nucleolar complex protein 3 putative [Albugo laibachii Nc14]